MLDGVWTDPLPAWYAVHGRHHLPWRRTLDPWAVLVSEVMLQQTSVGRVLPRWEAFLRRWPTPASCAAAPLEDVLREWAGLGYPRRARALHEVARSVAAEGWPAGEAGLLGLPGIGRYTARALLVLAFGVECDPPRDVNLGRVAARAGLGVEPHEAAPRRVEDELRRSRPAGMSARDHALALFDVGATLCTARRPRCSECPLAGGCAARPRLDGGPPPRPPRRPAYPGSMRQLRGAVLAVMLGDEPPATVAGLRERVATIPAAAAPGAVEAALAGLCRDRLLRIDVPLRPG